MRGRAAGIGVEELPFSSQVTDDVLSEDMPICLN